MKHFSDLVLGTREPGTAAKRYFPVSAGREARFPKEENMRKFALATAAVAALAFSAPAFTAPAFAQDVKVKIKSGDRGHHDGWRHRNVSKKVIIKHGDRGHHYGWRNHHGDVKKKVIIRHGEGGRSKTVIKKREG
jgi:hypothetical protein